MGKHAVTKAGACSDKSRSSLCVASEGEEEDRCQPGQQKTKPCEPDLNTPRHQHIFKNLTVEYQHLENKGNPIIRNNTDQPERHYAK